MTAKTAHELLMEEMEKKAKKIKDYDRQYAMDISNKVRGACRKAELEGKKLSPLMDELYRMVKGRDEFMKETHKYSTMEITGTKGVMKLTSVPDDDVAPISTINVRDLKPMLDDFDGGEG